MSHDENTLCPQEEIRALLEAQGLEMSGQVPPRPEQNAASAFIA